MKNALQCPQTLLFQANLSLNCLKDFRGPAMCKRYIFITGTNFICGTSIKNAFQCPQTLLLKANLSLNCLDVRKGPCYV